MKTPDFDDLLAAFDIPDATGLDAKEPIQGSHEETDCQLKHTGICLDDNLLSNQAVTTADVPVVSVIVKNTSRQESLEGFSDKLHSGQVLQNGFRGQDASADPVETGNAGFSRSFVSSLNGQSSRELLGKALVQHKPDGTQIFSQSVSRFSPVSSPGLEDAECSRNEMCSRQETLCLSEASVLVEATIPETSKDLDLGVFDNCPRDPEIHRNIQQSRSESSRSEESTDICANNEINKTAGGHSSLPLQSGNSNSAQNTYNLGNATDVSPAKSQTAKLSSCLEALVALNARKDPGEQTNPRESSGFQNDCVKVSPKVPISPRSPRSPLEAVKRLMKPSDSPRSICSDSSGKASPALASGSPPAIPRVRIKTIKTTSGQIRRTVTNVLPDSETDDFHSAYESSPSQSLISDDSYCNMSPHQVTPVLNADGIGGIQAKGFPASASWLKVLHNKSEAYTRRPGTKRAAAVFHSTGGHVKRSVMLKGQRPRRGPTTAAHTTSTHFLPKAMHLASLNLVPHSVAASVAARSTSHQQGQRTLSSTVCSTVPLVHQVKTASRRPRTSSSTTTAATLNRLLSNAKPVPTYVPNLTPPPESNIRLPPRGYCCLECGDSFGVERSLVHHYSRRSVHIEVGCTHCAQTVVFFNKCALMAHAREHKSNGVVMQCTQISVRPIAEEQMFVPPSAERAKANSAASLSPSARSQPVLPLYPDNVDYHRLRCLECNKQLPDCKALAGHYQRPSEDLEALVSSYCIQIIQDKAG